MAEAVPEPREGGALAATCLGFGCNPYGDLGFNGLPAEQATPGSMPYPEFLKAIKAKKVEGVVFQPPNGDVAYALIDGKSVRMGEGWPVEIANSWSSPTWAQHCRHRGRLVFLQMRPIARALCDPSRTMDVLHACARAYTLPERCNAREVTRPRRRVPLRRLALADGSTSARLARLVRVSRVLAATPGSDSDCQKPNASAKTAALIEDPMLATFLPKAASSDEEKTSSSSESSSSSKKKVTTAILQRKTCTTKARMSGSRRKRETPSATPRRRSREPTTSEHGSATPTSTRTML